uniref:Glycine-rich protein n=1 Tax=Chenopodium quinoa TaxID=63459 RepID=A0A803LFF7_CHEQI
MGIRSFWCVFLVLALVVVLHANAREVPKPKNIENQNNEVIVDPKNGTSGTGTKLVDTDTNTVDPTKEAAAKGVPKEGGDVNSDEKNFISFAGVGAAGGIGGVAGVIPIGGLGGFDKGCLLENIDFVLIIDVGIEVKITLELGQIGNCRISGTA